MATTFHSIVSIESPSAAVRKDTQGVRPTPSAFELEETRSWAASQPYRGSSGSAVGTQTPVTPATLESSWPTTPHGGVDTGTQSRDDYFGDRGGASADAELVQSVWSPYMNRYRVLSACFINLANGINDAAPGALLPYIEQHYGIGYAVVSLIFVSNALGFILAAGITHALDEKLGRPRALVAAELLKVAGFIAIVCAPPFPVVVAAYFFLGLGVAVGLSLNNVFCANLVNNTATLGAMHGSYGIGGTVSPLVATAMVTHGTAWNYFYTIVLVASVFNTAFAGWSFWTYDQDLPVQLLTALERTASTRAAAEGDSALRILRLAIHNRVTILAAFFIFAYQGAEVSISGWVITFLIKYRHGDPSKVGYVTSGFWAGITIGRFFLSHPAQLLGKKISVMLCTCGALILQLLVWFIPNVIGEAVAVAFVGLLLGPIYSCSVAVFTQLLPRKLQTGALSFISAMGSSGGAVAPFMTGLVAQEVGTFVLHPIAIGLFVVMVGCWISLPKLEKRRA